MGVLCFAALTPVVASAQDRHISIPPLPPEPASLLALKGWYSGDTHEHIQLCDDSVISLDDIRARMVVEHLDVASVLIWHRYDLPFTEFVCNLTPGAPTAADGKIIAFGVETSGLSCSRWGHLIGLGIGPPQARIAQGALEDGDCDDMSGLGLPGDGSGTISAPVAEHFFTSPGAICGYAHTIWSVGLHHPEGTDWGTELVDSGFTTDALYLDPEEPLAVPSVNRLLGIGGPSSGARVFFPLMGAMDAVLGNVQFIETIVMGTELPFPTTPPAHWTELYYKLLSAGVRIGLAAGSDRACFPSLENDAPVRTHVLVDGALSYGAWTRGLARGRISIADGNQIFLSFQMGGREVGSDLNLSSLEPQADVRVFVRSSIPLEDTVELVVGGIVRNSRAFTLAKGGQLELVFEDQPVEGSTWIAVRLGSQRAHTGAIYAIVDGRPVGDPAHAEYWMLWCDLVSKATLDHPELDFFSTQRDEALERIAKARRAFKTLRDRNFEPALGITREGRSIPAGRGPITMGAMTPARPGASFRLTCVNAPPEADGLLVLSHRPLAGASAAHPALQLAAQSLVEIYPVRSTRGGYAEVEVRPLPPGVPDVHAQFFWENPLDGRGADDARHSTSDRLRMLVR